MGLPPPTRGTLKAFVILLSISGITPAYAGNTQKVVTEITGAEDHPRLRGEHVLFVGLLRRILGSPPPTRGTPG